MFNDWKANRNVQAIQNPNISPIRCELEEMTHDELCFTLTRFLLEVRKQSGENYPSDTLYEILISIQVRYNPNHHLN